MTAKLPIVYLAIFLLLTIMAISPAEAAIEERISNGDFSSGLNSWYRVNLINDATIASATVSGETAARFTATWSNSGSEYTLEQSINLNQVDTLTYNLILIERYGPSTGTVFSVMIDGESVRSYTPTQMSTSWSAQSIDVSRYSGTGYHNVQFRVARYSSGSPSYVQLGLTDVSAIADTGSSPTLTSVSANPNPANINSPVTFTAQYTPGTPAATSFQWDFNGDGTWDSITDTPTTTYTYTLAATYTVRCQASNSLWNSEIRTVSLPVLPPKPAGVAFTNSPTSGSKPLVVNFYGEAGSGGTVTEYQWNFGDGNTATVASSSTSHIYSDDGTYDVTLTAVGPGGSSSYTKTSAVVVGDQYVRLDRAVYYIGTNDIVADYSILDYSSTTLYYLQLWVMNEFGEYVRQVNSYTISSATGQYTFPTTTLSGGTYSVVISRSGNTILASAQCQVRAPGNSITVIVQSNGATITESTTITVSTTDGVLVDSTVTTTGSATIQGLVDGTTYIVGASASGYISASKTVLLAGDTTITLDLGSGSGATGPGARYSPTVGTIIVYDEYGRLVPGVTVSCEGLDTSGPIEWINSIFGITIGSAVMDNQEAITDSNGQVTFTLLQNVRYRVTFSYPGATDMVKTYMLGANQFTYTVKFYLSAPTPAPASSVILTTVSGIAGTITTSYNDTSRSTTLLIITVKNSDGQIVDSWQSPTNNADQVFTIPNSLNADFAVEFVSNTTTYGTYTKTYPVHFNGPRVEIGIPAEFLFYLSLFLTLAIGGVFTRASVKLGCIVVVIAAWLFYVMGWLYVLEDLQGSLTVLGTLALAAGFAILINIIPDS